MNFQTCNLISNVQHELRKFWEVEALNPISVKLNEYEECEKHFETNVSRLPDGQFSVKLPFCREAEIANTYKLLLAALYRTKSMLTEETDQLYVDFMREYLEMGHMELVPANKIQRHPCFIYHITEC